MDDGRKGQQSKQRKPCPMGLLALKKALTESNIRVGFRGCGIWPLDFIAMKGNMEASKAFTTPSSSKAQDIFIQKIFEESLSSPSEGVIHYFVDHESSGDELPFTPPAETDLLDNDELINPTLLTTFLRLPQEGLRRKKTTSEPLVDYT